MRHSFISWDCSFRNFHHLIDALAGQDYNLDEIELIYVEQRQRSRADSYNHALGLPSLHDRARSGSFPFLKVLYMGDPDEEPYHLGKILNFGIRQARGDIITIMDGDMLLPPDFLHELDTLHRGGPIVVNIHRKMCPHPVGAGMDNWTEGQIDYQQCLNICRNPERIPGYVSNKGPMISAPGEAFARVGGYDEHVMFSTGLSRAGQDLNTRLELATGCKSQVIRKVAVHPYHPQGFSRKTLDAVRVLQIQASVIRWSRKNKAMHWQDRRSHLDSVYLKHRDLFRRVHEKNYSGVPMASIRQSTVLGRFHNGLLRLIHPFKP